MTITTSGVNPCTQSMVGSCQVLDCPMDAGSFVLTQTMHSAGPVSIGGTLLDGGMTITPRDGGYSIALAFARAWNGGETLTVSAPGDEVPAFSGQTVTAPNDFTLTAPACAAASCGSASRSQPLTVSWTGGAATGLSATLTTTGQGRYINATCPLGASPASIPAAVLAALPQSDAGYMTTLDVRASNQSTFAAGDYSVTFSAFGASRSGSLTVGP
jgi:hypothetical protein